MIEHFKALGRKRLALCNRIEACGKLAVAFSGGVDSTLLVAVAKAQLGDRTAAITVQSPLHSKYETAQAIELARAIGVRHIVFKPDLMADKTIRANGPRRCYHCKKVLFSAMQREAAKIGFHQLAHGANVDDCDDYRPGMEAAEEMGVLAPLSEAGLTKDDIRRLAREMGLPNWNKPAMACLATRLPYGTPIDMGVLSKIEAAEACLRKFGIGQSRVRCHGGIARIEVGEGEIERLMVPGARGEVVEALRGLGFRYVCLDLEGYVSGKMNRDLNDG
jgi:uncharacterized protein